MNAENQGGHHVLWICEMNHLSRDSTHLKWQMIKMTTSCTMTIHFHSKFTPFYWVGWVTWLTTQESIVHGDHPSPSKYTIMVPKSGLS
jgi:hypothetical protein